MTNVTIGHEQNLDWVGDTLSGAKKDTASTNRVMMKLHGSMVTGGWKNAKELLITEKSGVALSSFQVQIDIQGSDTTATNYVDFDKVKAGGADIRFTKSDMSTSLDYWIEFWDDGAKTARMWVEVDTIPAASNTTIYMWYNNTSASAASNGENTFLFFDDFSGTLSTKWNITGNPACVDGEYKVTGNGTWNANSAYTKTTFARPCVIEVKCRQSNTSTEAMLFGYGPNQNYSNTGQSNIYVEAGHNHIQNWVADGSHYEGPITQVLAQRKYKLVVLKYGNETWYDSSLVGTYTQLGYGYNQTADNYAVMGANVNSNGHILYLDDLRVRKYATAEPTVTFTLGELGVSATHSVIIDYGDAWRMGSLTWDAIEDPATSPDVEINTVAQAAPRTISVRGSNTAPTTCKGSFGYRRTVTITNSGSALSDFQVSFTFDSATLITNSKMQASCADIRITANDGITPLNFWVDDTTLNSASTKVWVRVPTVYNGDTTFYLWYGNTTATSLSNGDKTFEFFDDFSGGLSKWIVRGSMTIAGGELNIPSGTGSDSSPTYEITGGGKSYVYEMRVKRTSGTRIQPISAYINDYNFARWYINSSTETDFQEYVSGSWGTAYNDGSNNISDGTYYNFKIVRSATQVGIYLNGTQIGSNRTLNAIFQNVSTRVGISGYNVVAVVDNVFVRKYASTDPSASVGTESSPTSGIGQIPDSDGTTHDWWASWGSTTPSSWEEIQKAGAPATTYRYMEVRETLRSNY